MKIKSEYEINDFLEILKDYNQLFALKLQELKNSGKPSINGGDKTGLHEFTIDYFNLEQMSYVDFLGNKRNSIRKIIYLKNIEIVDSLFEKNENSFTDELSIKIKGYQYSIDIGNVIQSEKIEYYKNQKNQYIDSFIQEYIELGYYENACFFGNNAINLIGKKLDGHFILKYGMFGEFDISFSLLHPFKLYD